MIRFGEFYPTIRVLKEINRRLELMLDYEFLFLTFSHETDNEYIKDYFPSYLCKEAPDKCKNILEDLQEWPKDYYLHDMTCLHDYALYRVICNYSDAMDTVDDTEEGKGEPRFSIEKRDGFSKDELALLDGLQTGEAFINTLFSDIDFTYLDEIVYLYQTNRPVFDFLDIDIVYPV